MMKYKICSLVLKIVILTQFIFLMIVIACFNPFTGRILTTHYAQKYDINQTIFYRQIRAESHFRSFAISSKGAIGIGQIIYTTAVYMESEIKKWELYLPWKNLNISAKYMQHLLNRYNQNYSLALAAYNWGETNVSEKLRENNVFSIEEDKNYIALFQNIRETYSYLEKILR